MIDTVALGGELPPHWLREFGELLRLFLEPGLAPFYERLAPRFHAQFLAVA